MSPMDRVPAVLTPAGARVRDTAARLMSDRGVASVSMRDLAKELHMQAPSIYSHFPSQGALIEAVCSPYTNGVGRLLDVPRSSLPAFLEDWRRVIQFNLYAARIVHCDPAVRDISSGRLGRIQDLSIALILEKHGVPGLLADSLIAAWRAPWMRPVEGVDDRAVEAIGRHIMQVAEQSKPLQFAEVAQKCIEEAGRQRPILAIKLFRERTGLGLKDSKDWIERALGQPVYEVRSEVPV